MSALLSALNDDKKITSKNIFFMKYINIFFHEIIFHCIFSYIYFSPLFIISEPILSICLSNASSAFLPILENLPFNQFHILLHPLTFTRGYS